MPLITKAYTFQNGVASDAIQVNQDMDTLYNLINGLLDAVNIAANGLNDPNKFAAEVITQAKSKGLVYTQDLYGQSWVVSGGVTTASGSPANQITVTTLIANILQTDGSYRHVSVGGATYVTSIINATYYLELQPDGTMNWSQTHSAQANYMPIATVTSNASGNINVITDTRVTALLLKSPVKTPNNTLDDGTGKSIYTGFASIQYANGARIGVKATDAGVDVKNFDIYNYGGNLQLRFVNDADTAAGILMSASRSGITPAAVSFPNGSFATKSNTLDDGAGNATIVGALTVGAGGSFANSKVQQGYMKIAGGMIICWGNVGVTVGSSATVTFPVAFPTTAISASATPSVGANGNKLITGVNALGSTIMTIYLDTAAAATGSFGIYYIAIGY